MLSLEICSKTLQTNLTKPCVTPVLHRQLRCSPQPLWENKSLTCMATNTV